MGRGALDIAHRRWADPLGVDPTDGVLLSELRSGRRSLAELTRMLEVCGTSPDQIRASMGRLVERGLVEALPLVRSPVVS
jgi:hypothetical protein